MSGEAVTTNHDAGSENDSTTDVIVCEPKTYHSKPMPDASPAEDSIGSLNKRAMAKGGYYEHDAEAAYILSVTSAWAYADPEQLTCMLQRKFRNRAFDCKYIHVSNDALLVDTSAYVIHTEISAAYKGVPADFYILCFKGTSYKNATEWLIDAGTYTRQFLDLGMVHDGFYRNIQAIMPQVQKHLCGILKAKEVPEKDYYPPIYVCGHSLGGAQAVLAAAWLWNNPDNTWCRMAFRKALCGVYTYGGPMVGDPTFAESCKGAFAERVFRHVYDNDIVPRFPPRSVGDFQHVGKQYVSGDQGWVLRPYVAPALYTAVASNLIALLSFPFKVFPITRRLVLPFSWEAHKPLNYIECSRIQECYKTFG